MMAKWQRLAAGGYDATKLDAQEPSYHLQVLADDGAVLEDLAVDPVEVADAEWVDVLAFSLTFGLPEGAARLRLMDGDAVLAERAFGPAVPSVEVLQPAGGELVDDTLTVVWRADDPDAETLHCALQYSPDLGKSWRALVVNQPVVAGQPFTVTLDASSLPGTATGGLIRVVASDGLYTGLGTSGAFEVPDRRPEPSIVSPADGMEHPATELLTLIGAAIDAEEGTLAGEALTWFLNGREVGVGSDLLLDGLAPGGYQVELMARDPSEQESWASAEVQVLPLFVPEAAEPVLDGDSGDAAYNDAPQLRLAPYGDGSQAVAMLLRTETHLWVTVSGLQRSAPEAEQPSVAGVLIDAGHGQEPQAEADDRAYYVSEEGELLVWQGDGMGDILPLDPEQYPEDYDAVVSRSANTWSVEMSLPLEAVSDGGMVGLAVAQHGPDDLDRVHAWPHGAVPTVPQSWAATVVGETVRVLLIPMVLK
jgi:hypothetical protein